MTDSNRIHKCDADQELLEIARENGFNTIQEMKQAERQRENRRQDYRDSQMSI